MIICSAIKIQFQHKDQTVEVVIPGLRHSDCYDLMHSLNVPMTCEKTEGFIDHHSDFYDRYDAYEHAILCGQLSDTTRTTKRERGERQLFSEDLY